MVLSTISILCASSLLDGSNSQLYRKHYNLSGQATYSVCRAAKGDNVSSKGTRSLSHIVMLLLVTLLQGIEHTCVQSRGGISHFRCPKNVMCYQGECMNLFSTRNGNHPKNIPFSIYIRIH